MLDLFSGENGRRDTLSFVEEKAAVGLWFWDLKTKKMEWSSGFFHLLGLEPGGVEPSYMLLEAMVHPDDVRPPGEIDQLLNQAGSIERQFRLILRNRRVRHVLSRGEVLLDWEGRPDTAIGVMVDVTRQCEAQSRMEALRERYRRLVEAMAAIVWTVNSDGPVEDLWNWQNFTGQSLNSAIGYGWLGVVHPEEQGAVRQLWDASIAGRSAFELEFRLRRADGIYRWVQMRVRPTIDLRGSVSEWLAVCVDIHDHKVWPAAAKSPLFTGSQLRAARGILNWSVRQLADSAGVGVSAIRRVEEFDGPPKEFEHYGERVRQVLEEAGVEFLFPPLGKPGVRLR
jgi:PAS domain S-box-containing protein